VGPSIAESGIVQSVDSVLSFTAVVTVAAASFVRYVVVLVAADQRRVERMTAFGFHAGIFAALALFALDRLLA